MPVKIPTLTIDGMHALLEELCDLVRNTSLCGLGQSAPNPVLTTLRYDPSGFLCVSAPPRPVQLRQYGGPR